MMRILLDSVILIDHFNDIKKASDYIEKNSKNELFISAITRAEVLMCFDNKTMETAKRLLDQFSLIPITQAEADLAAILRKQHRWKLPDALQAAAATTHQAKLATRNTKDFNPALHRFVIVPYSLKTPA